MAIATGCLHERPCEILSRVFLTQHPRNRRFSACISTLSSHVLGRASRSSANEMPVAVSLAEAYLLALLAFRDLIRPG